MNFDVIMAEYQDALRAFLLSRLRSPDDVDDLMQEVMTKTFQNLHTLKDTDKLKSWLFRIAQNALMDHFRRAKRGANLIADDLWYAEEEDAGHAFEGCVEPFLKALPDDVAAMLRAVELEGQAQKDYATEIGVSYSTLKSRVQSARRQLRILFEECCDIAYSADGNVIDYQRKPGSCGSC